MRKILLILVVCLCFCSCAEKGKMTKEQTVSSEVLQEQQAEVFESVTKDFDGNGTEETFQLRREGKILKLWFVGDGGESLWFRRKILSSMVQHSRICGYMSSRTGLSV